MAPWDFLSFIGRHLMKKRIQTGLLVASMVLSGGAVLAQQQPVDLGKIEFESNCASCHGIDGKGNGPLATLLQRRPPDLTVLTKNNQGVFPINRLYEVIDGRGVPSHGTRDMPVWGRTYQVEQAQLLREARGLYDSPAAVRARILLLLEYISRIQTR
jgi:mono/diheme cytochrome c family protein